MSSRPQYGPDGRLLPFDCDRCGKVHLTSDGAPACVHHKKNGQPCGSRPRAGTSICAIHGAGKRDDTPAMRGAKRRLTMAAARQEMELQLGGGELDVTPDEWMLGQVREAAWNVAALRPLVTMLQRSVDGTVNGEVWQPGQGIAGRVDPENFKAEAHVFVKMYDNERDRAMRYAKMCRDAGVAEAQVRIAEEQGRWLTSTLDLVLERLQLTPEQNASLPLIMRDVIGVLEQGQDG